jgi:TolB-like protein/DNA-binding winged helix-turn-helix (wHTH) protein
VELKQGFRIGPFEVRPLTGEVSGPHGTTHLEPKVIEVLVALALKPGDVVEREELLQRVWGNRAAVSDEPLTRCIAELRRAFGDSRSAPSYIQTIPKRGYRLLHAITPLAAAAPAADPSPPRAELPAATPSERDAAATAPSRGSKRRLAGAFVVLGLLAAVGAGLLLRDGTTVSPGTERSTIAVLPFTDVSDAADGAYFGEGLADEIMTRLNAVDGLRVVARTSSFAVRDSTDDVRSIAARLQVAHVLEGTVRRDGERVRIGAQLIDAERGYQLWAQSYDGVLGDIFELQDEIANTIVAKLRETLSMTSPTTPIATPAPTDNLAAYELLLRGRQFLHRRDEEPLRRSIRLFQEALELDPEFGEAYIELAKAYALLPSYSAEIQEEMFDLALATLATGVAQDPALDDSMQVVVALIAYARWDWIGAEVAFRRALERSRGDPDLYVWYSQFLSAVGRPHDSADYARRAKDIDLLSPVANHRLAVASLWVNDDAGAARQLDVAAELGMGAAANPDSYIVLKLRQGDHAAIRPLLIGVQTMFARPTAWVDPLLAALESSTQRDRAIAALAAAEAARDIPRKYLFGAWIYLGESDRALATGLQLVNDRPSFNVEFMFSREARSLRTHPRFGELVRAIGLNRYWEQFGWPELCREEGEHIVCH